MKLIDACENGEVGFVRKALSNKTRKFTRKVRGRTILHAACQGGHLEVVKLICAREPLLVSVYYLINGALWSPFEFAIESNSFELVEWLIATYNEYCNWQNGLATDEMTELLQRHGKLSERIILKMIRNNKYDQVQRFITTPVTFHMFMASQNTEMNDILLDKPNVLSNGTYTISHYLGLQVVDGYTTFRAQLLFHIISRFPEWQPTIYDLRILTHELFHDSLLLLFRRGAKLYQPAAEQLVQKSDLTVEELVSLSHFDSLVYYAVIGKQTGNVKRLLREPLNKDPDELARRLYYTPLSAAMRFDVCDKIKTLLIIHGASVKYYPEEIQRIYITYQNILQAYLLAYTRCGEFRLGEKIASYLTI